jgi:hypothetical protein
MFCDDNEPPVAGAQTPFLEASSDIRIIPGARRPFLPAQFDQARPTGPSMANLKKLQDPAKFAKARFSLRLYNSDQLGA